MRKDWPYLLIITTLIFALYGRTIQFGFVLDDLLVIEENRFVQRGLAGILDIFKHSYAFGYTGIEDGAYRPFSLAVFALEYSLFGNSTKMFHLFNVLYYAITCILLWQLLIRLFPQTQKKWILLATLLFVAHPMHTEVVANIKSRDEIFCFLFFLSAFLIWIKPIRSIGDNTLLSVFLVASALSKETGVVLITALPLWSWAAGGKTLKESIHLCLWLILPIVIALGFRLSAGIQFSYENSAIDIELINNSLLAITEPLDRFSTKLYLVGLYIIKLIFPHPLSFDYSFNHFKPVRIYDWEFWMALVSIAGLVFIGIRLRKKSPYVAFAIGFFILALFIYTNLAVQIASTFADRFLYIPSFALSLVVLVYLPTKRLGVLVITGMALILYTAQSFARIPDWESNEKLVLTDLEKVPNSAKAQLFASTMYRKRALLQPGATELQNRNKALYHIKQAIRIYPDYGDAYGELTEILRETKRYEDVIKVADKRLKDQPYHHKMRIDKAAALFELRRYDEALSLYTEMSADTQIEQKRILFNYAAIHFNRREFEKAVPIFNRFLELEPGHGYTHLNLGTAWFELEDYDKAYHHLGMVPIGDPNYGLARVNMGHTALFMENMTAARDHYLTGLTYFPDDPSVIRNLAVVYMSLGDSVRGQEYFKKVQLLELTR